MYRHVHKSNNLNRTSFKFSIDFHWLCTTFRRILRPNPCKKNSDQTSDLKLLSLFNFANLSKRLKSNWLFSTLAFHITFSSVSTKYNKSQSLMNVLFNNKTKAVSKREVFWNFKLDVIQMYRQRTIEQILSILTANRSFFYSI